MLEAMRAGVNECVAEPLQRRPSSTPRSSASLGHAQPVAAGQVFAFVGAKGGVGTTTVAVNVATALARRRRRADAADRPAPGVRRRGGVPRRRAAVLGASTRSRTSTGSTRRSSRAWSCRRKAGVAPAGVVRRAGATGTSMRRACAALLEFAAAPLPLHRPRRAALRRRRARRARAGVATIVVVANQELATVRNASRIAATLRQRYGNDRVTVVSAASTRRPRSAATTSSGSSARRSSTSFPSDYRLALQALNKGRPLALDNHNKLAASVPRARARSRRRRAGDGRPRRNRAGCSAG